MLNLNVLGLNVFTSKSVEIN